MDVLSVFALGSENEDGDDPTADKKQGVCVQSPNQLLMHSWIWKFGSNGAAVTILDCCVKELELKKNQNNNSLMLLICLQWQNRLEHQHQQTVNQGQSIFGGSTPAEFGETEAAVVF